MLCPCAVTCTRLVLLLLFLFRALLERFGRRFSFTKSLDTGLLFQRKRVSWLITDGIRIKNKLTFTAYFFKILIQKLKKETILETFFDCVLQDLSTKKKKAASFTKNKRLLDCTTLINSIIITPVLIFQ